MPGSRQRYMRDIKNDKIHTYKLTPFHSYYGPIGLFVSYTVYPKAHIRKLHMYTYICVIGRSFWTNLAPTQTLQNRFNKMREQPPPSLEDFLQNNDFKDWTIPSLVGHNRAPPNDRYNIIGRPLAVLPKFVCYPNQRAYRLRGGYGRLRHKGVLTIPTVRMKELAMGFQTDKTKAGGLADAHRHYLLGQCIDLNLLTWLMQACEAPNALVPQTSRPHSLQPPEHPLAAKQRCGNDNTHIQQERLPHLHNALPLWQPAHDPTKFTYTDGSTKEGCPILGAAVYHAPTHQTLHVDATGIAECNTIVRAELTAIYEALQQYSDLQELHILTDSLTAIQKLLLLNSQPMRSAKDHHATVLHMIRDLLIARPEKGLHTSINKVKAHTGIKGSEIADQAAKEVVRAMQAIKEDTNADYPDWVQDTKVPRNPHRKTHYLTDDPPEKEDGSEPYYRVPVNKQEINKKVDQGLRHLTSPPSLYWSLMHNARLQEEEPTDLLNTAKHIMALIHKGAAHQPTRLIAFLWGVMYTQKQAYRFRQSPDQICPVCKAETDSCTHVGSGCQNAMMKGLYIDRHNAAVRLISRFISNSPVGASSLSNGLTLVSQDAGTKPLPEDSLDGDDPDGREALLGAAYTAHNQSPLEQTHCPKNHITNDVTVDLEAYEVALAQWLLTESKQTDTQPTPSSYRLIPDWVLPAEAQDRLLPQQAGIKPDIVFVRGAPSPNPTKITAENKSQWRVVIIEVGFCADLRLLAKRKEKTEKYQPLIQELRKTWKHVQLIVVPIGNAGALLQTTKQELAVLTSTQPQGKKIDGRKAEQLGRTLTTVAARRLYHITRRYYEKRRERQLEQEQRQCEQEEEIPEPAPARTPATTADLQPESRPQGKIGGKRPSPETPSAPNPQSKKGCRGTAKEQPRTKWNFRRRHPWTSKRKGRPRRQKPENRVPEARQGIQQLQARPPEDYHNI